VATKPIGYLASVIQHSGHEHAVPQDATPLSWWQACTLTAFFAFAPSVIMAMLAVVIGKVMGMSLADAQQLAGHEPLVFALVSVLSVLPALWLVRQPLPRAPWRQAFAVKPTPILTIAAALLTGIAMQLPLSEVGNLMEWITPVSLEQKLAMAELLSAETPIQALKLSAAVVIAAPISEELLFRGAFLRGLQRTHPTSIALVLSATLFGVSHAGFATAVFPATLAGLALGMVTLRTGSILASIVMHAAVNAVPVLVTRSRLEIPGFNTVQAGVYHVPLHWLLPSCAIAGVGLWWLNRSGGDEHAVGVDNETHV
jgi:membrane protease YdiL (CAAX protease family)